MNEVLKDILYFIEIDFFIGYGLYTIIYIILKLVLKNNETIKRIDKSSSNFIAFCGFLYLVIWITAIIVFLIESDVESKNKFLNRAFGSYWFGYWIQPLLWIGITQLLRLDKINQLIIIRLIFGLLLIFSFERYVIIMTSIERDYISSSWIYFSTEFSITEMIFWIFIKIIVFVIISIIFNLIGTKIKKTFYSIRL